MKRIFLSASVPKQGRGDFFDTANPFLIQFAVRELLTVALGRRQIVWGGHPAITPMVWAVCQDMGVEYANAVLLYQSLFFKNEYPEENLFFENAVYVDAVQNELEASLLKMRSEMLSLEYEAAVFIGGMEGIFEEYELFINLHPEAKILALGSPGGAARQLGNSIRKSNDRIDFASLFYETLDIDSMELRNQLNIKPKNNL